MTERRTFTQADGSTVEVELSEVIPADTSLDHYAIPSGIIICNSKCWACKFGDCDPG